MIFINSKKQIIKVNESEIELLSPYDDSFPANLLAKGFTSAFNIADVAVEKVYKIVSKSMPEVVQLNNSLSKDIQFVLDISEQTKKRIQSGELKLTVENGGKTYAQFRNNNGKYGKKIPIKRQDFSKNFDPVQMANAMQMKAIQNQLESMTKQLKLIDSSAREILQGQQNDRIALYYSGLSLYLQAKNISDKELKNQILSQSIRALSDARFQLDLSFNADLNYLILKKFEEHKKESIRLIDERINCINQSFKYIHLTSLLLAGIYCEQGELTAMTSVLSDYSNFISNKIADNAPMLAEYDTSDKGINSRGWKSRANFELNISKLKSLIDEKDKVIYLTTE